jgi:GntR family transcriptional regulator / MocR family aminotransferase
MDIHIGLSRRDELTSQIYRQLLNAVWDGRLRPGERLPPTRELARRLEVSRNTVGVAYELLAAGRRARQSGRCRIVHFGP